MQKKNSSLATTYTALPYTWYCSNSFKEFNLVNPHENNSNIITTTTVPSIFQMSRLRAKKVM